MISTRRCDGDDEKNLSCELFREACVNVRVLISSQARREDGFVLAADKS